jgi:hypothetical protein
MMDCILLLDVDGVLNSHRLPGENGGLDASCCYRLLDVIRATECYIVLSSAWRYMGHGPGSVFAQCLRGVLGNYTAWLIRRRIIDATRLESAPERRHETILAWVEEHRPKTWVAVDDLVDIELLGQGHYVRTDGQGLTDADALRLIQLLNAGTA